MLCKKEFFLFKLQLGVDIYLLMHPLYLFVFSWNGIGWLLLLQETGIGDEHARI
jgi:hypothetical protein